MNLSKPARKQVPPIGLRLPTDLKEWLAAKAAENQRSINGEAIWALQQYRKSLGGQGNAQAT